MQFCLICSEFYTCWIYVLLFGFHTIHISTFSTTRFHWKTNNFPPEVSISPVKGYICPGMEVPFDVTFAPEELSNDMRHENLSCFVESSSPINLTVTGSCIAPSISKEVHDALFLFRYTVLYGEVKKPAIYI